MLKQDFLFPLAEMPKAKNKTKAAKHLHIPKPGARHLSRAYKGSDLNQCPDPQSITHLKGIKESKLETEKRGYLGGELLVCDATHPISQSTPCRGEEPSGGPPGKLLFPGIGGHCGL